MGSYKDITMGLTHTAVTLLLVLHRVIFAAFEEYQHYDDYDPNDIPRDQARPVTGGYLPPPKTSPPPSGYSYPVPVNRLELPERARTGKLVIEESSSNLLIIGLKHNEFDSYDPEEYDHNDPDYVDAHPNEIAPENTEASLKTSFDKLKKHSAFSYLRRIVSTPLIQVCDNGNSNS